MKGIIIIAILVTLAVIFGKFKKNQDVKQLLIGLGTFGLIISLAVMGNLTRSVMPIFIAHLILVIGAWGSLFLYIVRNKYYWWMYLLPFLSIGLFLLLEFYTGSGNEAG